MSASGDGKADLNGLTRRISAANSSSLANDQFGAPASEFVLGKK